MAMSTKNATFAPLKNSNMPLYIPRVDTRSVPSRSGSSLPYEDMVKDFIAKQFHYQQIGETSRIDLLEKKTPDGWTFYIAFVHFDHWYDTTAANKLIGEINDPGKKAKLQFNERWYWIVNENQKPLTAEVVDLHRVIREQQADIDNLTQLLSNLTLGGGTVEQPPTVLQALTFPPIKCIAKCIAKQEAEHDQPTLTPTELPLLADMPEQSTPVVSKPRMKRAMSDAEPGNASKKSVVKWSDADTEDEDDNSIEEVEPGELEEPEEEDDSSMEPDLEATD